jgi:hypothetical protein
MGTLLASDWVKCWELVKEGENGGGGGGRAGGHQLEKALNV